MAIPVMPGIPYTAADIKYAVGNISNSLRADLVRADNLKAFLATIVDADLISLGLTQAEVNIIRSAFATELSGLYTTFKTLTFIKQCWGLGL